MIFEDTVGKTFNFYGVDNHAFKLGRHIFDVVEDEDDGYRSMLQEIQTLPEAGGLIFRKRPLEKVLVSAENDTCFNGYRLTSVKDGHIWLRFGTDYSDDYYPCFIFDYGVRKPK